MVKRPVTYRNLLPGGKSRKSYSHEMKETFTTESNFHSNITSNSFSDSEYSRESRSIRVAISPNISINTNELYNEYVIDQALNKFKIPFIPRLRRRRAKMMTMIYLCDSFNETNSKSVKMPSIEILKEYVENFKQSGAKIVCEVAIPGVEKYRMIKQVPIPEYPANGSLNESPGIFIISI